MMGVYVILWLMVAAAAAARVGWFVGRRRRVHADDAPWRQSDLYVDGDDWELWDVQWRRSDGRILEERGVHVSRVLLKGAEARFLQVFDARDGSMPVIQRNSLDTEREESDE